MMFEDYSIAEWVEQADDSQREFREAVHTILAAIANDPQLRANMVIKGGILLAVRYQGVIRSLQDKEIERANYVAKKLGIPLLESKIDDAKAIVEWLAAMTPC